MKISRTYITPAAQRLLESSEGARQAYEEVRQSILRNTNKDNKFYFNDSMKKGNGVRPVKHECYRILEEEYGWYREKPLNVLKHKYHKGGPIDVYKEYPQYEPVFKAGLEFETGNVSSAHRSANKLRLGMKYDELDISFLMMPIEYMHKFLTDRVSNYEEIEPYMEVYDEVPMIFFGFEADVYDKEFPFLPKGKDGMSDRSIRKWSDKDKKGPSKR